MNKITENFYELIPTHKTSTKNNILSDTSSSIHFNRLYGYNTSGDQMIWIIYSINGDRLYVSDIINNKDTWTLDLSTTNIASNTQLRISCMSPYFSGVMDNEEILTYTPDSNATAYYQLDISSRDLKFTFNGVVPPYYYPNADPYLKSSGVLIKNASVTLSKYAFYSLDGTKLYESDRYSEGETATINFKDTGIEEYAIFRVKALVVAGSDSTCDVMMQYIPDSYYVGKYELSGITVNTTLIFKGSYSLIPDPSDTIIADEVLAYNDSTMGAKFAIILLDGTKIYESDKIYQWEKDIIDLKDLHLETDMYVRLKIILLAKDLFSDIFIKYSPNTGTAYYKLVGRAAVPNSHEIYYYDVLSPETTPPLLKCSTIIAHNFSNMITKWSFISNGQTIFTSGRCRIGHTSTLSLTNIAIESGTRFLLKANAIAGEDSTAYVTIEYDPTSNATAEFEFDGPANKTILMYEGKE